MPLNQENEHNISEYLQFYAEDALEQQSGLTYWSWKMGATTIRVCLDVLGQSMNDMDVLNKKNAPGFMQGLLKIQAGAGDYYEVCFSGGTRKEVSDEVKRCILVSNPQATVHMSTTLC